MKYSVDRVEEGLAVLVGDDGETLVVELSLLPEGTDEGSVLDGDPENGFTTDIDEQIKRRKENFDLLNSLFDK